MDQQYSHLSVEERAARIATLDEVRPRLAEELQNKKFRSYVEDLRKNAKVQ